MIRKTRDRIAFCQREIHILLGHKIVFFTYNIRRKTNREGAIKQSYTGFSSINFTPNLFLHADLNHGDSRTSRFQFYH